MQLQPRSLGPFCPIHHRLITEVITHHANTIVSPCFNNAFDGFVSASNNNMSRARLGHHLRLKISAIHGFSLQRSGRPTSSQFLYTMQSLGQNQRRPRLELIHTCSQCYLCSFQSLINGRQVERYLYNGFHANTEPTRKGRDQFVCVKQREERNISSSRKSYKCDLTRPRAGQQHCTACSSSCARVYRN